MAWTDPSTQIVVTGQIITASQWNTIQNNLIDLDRRTSPAGAIISTQDATSSTAYGDLTVVGTPGPAVTVQVGTTGKALCAVYARLSSDTANGTAHMSVNQQGGPVDDLCISYTSYASSPTVTDVRAGATWLFTGLSTGMMTTMAKYRAGGAGGTAYFSARRLLVTPLGS